MRVLFTLLMKFIVSVTNGILYPINQIVANSFPSFNEQINLFNSYMGRLITPSLSWFFNILPPNTRALVLFYLSLLIIFYGMSFAIHGVIKVIEIIKNIKVW